MDEIDGRPHAGQADMDQADMDQDAAHAVPCGCVRALRAGPEAALPCACVRGNRDRHSSSAIRSAHSSSAVRSAHSSSATGAGVPMSDNGLEGERGESS